MEPKDLKIEINNIDIQIQELTSKRAELESEYISQTTTKWFEKFRSWNLPNEANLIMFCKEDRGYHWCIAKTVVVKTIDEINQYIDTITTDYYESDYQYWCRAEENRIYFSNLEELEKDYHIYLVDPCQVVMTQHKMCNLYFTYSNYKDFEKTIKDSAIKVIS